MRPLLLNHKKWMVLIAALIVLVSIYSCSIFPGNNNGNLVLNGIIETEDIQVGSKIGGRVVEVLVREGDIVKQGDLLIRLDDNELTARREQVLASMKQAQENIRQKNARLELVVSGNRQQEIDRAKAELDAVNAKLKLALEEDRRYRILFQQGAVSRQQSDNAASQLEVLKSQATSAEESYNLLKSGFRKEEITQARADLAQANAYLSQLNHSLEEINTQLDESSITAPLDSIVEICDFQPGDILSPNQSALTLILPDRLWVRVYSPENYLGHMKENMSVQIKVDSYKNELFKGSVEQINRQAEFTPRNIQTVEERVNTVFGVKIRLMNDSGKLRAGMGADVIFPGIKKK